MFTGLVEEIGKVIHLKEQSKGIGIEISASRVMEDLQIGDSIAVNGCCLTVVELSEGSFSCDIVSVTWECTCLCDLVAGDPVNLERAMSPQKRFGGHFVQGHVDGVGSIAQKIREPDDSTLVTINAPMSLLRYIIHKGSIAVDGVSLTVASCSSTSFTIALIPHTLEFTNLGRKEVCKRVNLEVDLIAKYVEKLHG